MEKVSKSVEFTTSNNKYIFDAVSGEVIPAGEWRAYIINNYYLFSKKEMAERHSLSGHKLEYFKKEYHLIEKLINEGMFYYSENSNLKFELEDYIYRSSSSQLILVLTGKCNMRCEYCVYCEKYPQEIGYTEEDMDFETAKKGVDIYFKIHKEKVAHGLKKQPMINFYGGEPLIKFDLIKRIVSYIESIDKNARFFITTNGLLLNKEVAEFVSNHKFTITFSLDGFKENHDRNRVTAGGTPTFDRLVNNIKMLQQIKREKHVVQPISFNCCFDNFTDLGKCISFFDENYNEFSPFFTMYNQISPFDTSYYEWTKERVLNGELQLDENAFSSSYKKVYHRVFEEKENGHERELSMNLFISYLILYLRNKWNTTDFNNSCIPLSKLAVYPAGELCLCEKMNKKLIIGNVEQGIDKGKLLEYTKVLTENFRTGRCSKCTARKICPACFMYLNSDGKFKDNFCEKQKRVLCERLSELYQILEKNPNFLKSLHVSKDFVEVLETNN